jgi:pilus assembly protein CpaE
MRAVLICPNVELREKFTKAIGQHSTVTLSKSLDEYPSSDYLRRVVCAWSPEVIFLDIEDTHAAETIALQLEKDFPTVRPIALHSVQDPSIFRRVLEWRMRELLSPPFDAAELGTIFGRIEKELEVRPATIGFSEHFFAFVPAKGGVGASTIAANASWAMSKVPNKRTLLMDLDRFSGITGFQFKAEHDYRLVDAATRAGEWDAESWGRLVKKVGNLDLLLSGAPYVEEGVSRDQMTRLVDFCRRNYDVISVDLADTFDETSLGVLREARRIFLVTTPELPALRLARLKVLLFQKLDIQGKVTMLLNRASKRMELTIDDIEGLVGLPVFMSFPCDYANVAKSLRDGQPASKLTGAIREFTDKVLNTVNPPIEKRSRFIERIAVVPLRYGFSSTRI